MIHVEKIDQSERGLKPFLDLSYRLYQNDPLWAPPAYAELQRSLLGVNNEVLQGEHRFLMAYDDERPVARVLAGVDARLNERLGARRGYIALFECERNVEYARAVLEAACDYLHALGMDQVVGPNTPMRNDFSKGLLYEGFDGAPMIFNPYNPAYYNDFFAACGFAKHRDHYAYHLSLKDFPMEEYRRLSDRAQKRFRFTVRDVNLTGAKEALLAEEIAEVIDAAFPDEWELVPPTARDILDEMKALKRYFEPGTLTMAYADQRPVGLFAAFPNVNPLLRQSRGRAFPFGWLTMLLGRERVRSVRCTMLFVVPEYQNKAVGVAMILAAYEHMRKRGVTEAEASTIDETNLRSVINTERTGAKRYRVYRQYAKRL